MQIIKYVGDLGIVMVRHDGSESNVLMSYDEDDDILRFGYTDDSAHGTTIANTSDKLNVSITVTSLRRMIRIQRLISGERPWVIWDN